MVEDGLWTPRRLRDRRVHPPRHRRVCRGELVQIDGSEHDWFEDRGRRCVLLVFVDDATGELMELRFARSESTFEYFTSVRRYLEKHGRPVAFYSDKASIFRVNRKEHAGSGLTPFGRAMGELNIDVICAHSAPAKGRVQPAHQTLQDRLVKELRLAGVDSIEDGNIFLPSFVADYNRRFGRPPASQHDAHRPLLPHEPLDDIFKLQVERKLSRNLTLHYQNVLYVLEATEDAQRAKGQRVRVYEDDDGNVSIRAGDVELPGQGVPEGAEGLRHTGRHRRRQTPGRRAERHPGSADRARAGAAREGADRARATSAEEAAEERRRSLKRTSLRSAEPDISNLRRQVDALSMVGAGGRPACPTSPPPSCAATRTPRRAPSSRRRLWAAGSASRRWRAGCGPRARSCRRAPPSA
ncbi:MAG: ISNCY family transposase [Sandaracinaceae bacterium]|nr:ISNCY family transposase [Sandaracinaceae bacterium]